MTTAHPGHVSAPLQRPGEKPAATRLPLQGFAADTAAATTVELTHRKQLMIREVERCNNDTATDF